MQARFWNATDGGTVQCHLCPHDCVIAPGHMGLCAVRENRAGVLYTLNYCCVSSAAVDPIEKKPLYHFHPGSTILSFGTFGCNLACQCCQNFRIAKEFPRHALNKYAVTPDELIADIDHHAPGGPLTEFCGVAYTYSEPIVWAETILDVAPAVRERGYKNVLVTNGFVNMEPLEALLEYVDALNIDLKSFDDAFYRTCCSGRRDPVLKAIERCARSAHVELTTLIIPTLNDDADQLAGLRDWVADTLGPDTPVHLSRYFPTYKLSIPPTTPETLHRARDLLAERLRFVYVGNLGEEQNTHCPSCDALVINRQGYRVRPAGLTPEGACAQCGAAIAVMG
jgi:pyruvate formate lyase activating enzyme